MRKDSSAVRRWDVGYDKEHACCDANFALDRDGGCFVDFAHGEKERTSDPPPTNGAEAAGAPTARPTDGPSVRNFALFPTFAPTVGE